MAEKIKVLVVDESVIYRHFFSEALSGMPDVELAAVAANCKIALARLTQIPADVILMDMEIEEREVVETLKTIRAEYPDIGVVPMCGLNSAKADVAIRALEMGALDLLTKPEPNPASLVEFRSRLEPVLRAFSGRKHVRLARRLTASRLAKPAAPSIVTPAVPATDKKPPAPRPRVMPTVGGPLLRIDVVVIGVSTGGPNALTEVISRLPKDLGVPVLLVQHMPPLFTAALAESLNKKSALQVREAAQGDEVLPNVVYIAPGGKHMTVVNQQVSDKNEVRIALNTDPPVNSCRPAVDVLFRSVATVYPGRALATIMTGMGNDGAEGVRAMKVHGCYCLSQSEETCVVYGMPRAVDEAGLSDEQVPLDQIAIRIETLVKKKVR